MAKTYPPKALDWKFVFGKYKEKTIKQVIDENPGYIHWAVDNMEGFQLTKESTDYLASKA